MEPLVSIVIPVYNVENYLNQCLESVKRQTYGNLEIILVDDGSDDNSGSICDQFKIENPNTKVIHQHNQGLSAARNNGVKISSGEYITFLDSDDWLNENYVKYLYNMLAENDADVACTSYYSVWDDKIPEEESNRDFTIKVYNTEEALTEICYGDHFGCSAPDKLYKRELICSNPFPTGKLYEDLGTMYKIIGQSNKIVYSPRKLSYYRRRSTSIVNSNFTNADMYIIEAAEEQLSYIKEHYANCIKAAMVKCCYVLTQLTSKVLNGSEEERIAFGTIRSKAKLYWKPMVFNGRTAGKHKARTIFILCGYDLARCGYKATEWIKRKTGKKMQS